jgi:copper(I)-binding protein
MSGPRVGCALALLCVASAAPAVEIQARNPWVRSAAQGQAATPAYVEIVSDTVLKLVGAKSPWARKVEFRAVEIRDGLPVERTVAALDMPAGAAMRLAPGGEHLALIDVTRAFGNGDFVPITLDFEDASKTPHTLDLKAQARGLLLPKGAAPKSE